MAIPGIKNGKNAGKNVGSASKGAGVAGSPGKSMPAQPIPGPVSPGMPISMKKALKRK